MRIIRLTGFGTVDFETSITDTDSATTPTSVYVYPLEGDVDECIGLLPKPGCGFEPTQAGDRGGALQYAVFGLIVIGVVVVFSVVFRNVIRRDNERAKHA